MELAGVNDPMTISVGNPLVTGNAAYPGLAHPFSFFSYTDASSVAVIIQPDVWHAGYWIARIKGSAGHLQHHARAGRTRVVERQLMLPIHRYLNNTATGHAFFMITSCSVGLTAQSLYRTLRG